MLTIFCPVFMSLLFWLKIGLFFTYFWSFQANNTNFTTNLCEKVHPVSGAWITTHDPLFMSLRL